MFGTAKSASLAQPTALYASGKSNSPIYAVRFHHLNCTRDLGDCFRLMGHSSSRTDVTWARIMWNHHSPVLSALIMLSASDLCRISLHQRSVSPAVWERVLSVII